MKLYIPSPPYMRNVEPVTDFLRLFFMTSSSRIVYFKGTPHIESILKSMFCLDITLKIYKYLENISR